MDPQAPSTLATPPVAPKDSHGITIAAMAVFVLLALAAVVFLYYQNQQLKNMLASYQTPAPSTSPIYSPIASASPSAMLTPIVISPLPGAKIISPLKVIGTVPPGWMNEGVFLIQLADSDQNLIAQAQAKEKVPGSWQSGNPVDFTATIPFNTASASGFLILKNDNPSGIPANSKTFQVEVSFLTYKHGFSSSHTLMQQPPMPQILLSRQFLLQLSHPPRTNWHESFVFIIFGILIGAGGLWGYQTY